MIKIKSYSKAQTITGTIIYISLVVSIMMIIGSAVWALSDVILRRGKTELFLRLSIGLQIAIVGAFLAGLFFLIIFAYGLFKRGVGFFLKIIFRSRELDKKFENRTSVKLAAGLLMLSLFAILIGIVIAIFYEIFRAIIGNAEFTITGITENYSGGVVALIISALCFSIAFLIFFLTYMWFNGYGLIIKLLYTLEDEA